MLPAQRAAQAQRFLAIERRLFEVLGGWVPTVPEPEVKLVLRAHSFQHAWHADLWESLLPAGGGDADLAGDDRLLPLFDALAGPAATVERLAGFYSVLLPALVVAYGASRAEASPATQGPRRRALGLMLADDVEAQRVGVVLLEGESWPERAASHVARLRQLLDPGGLG